MIRINLEKAKEIKKNNLRKQRAGLLQKLDVDFQRALETNADTSSIVAEKQRLRDITNLVDTVTSLEQLKTITV